MYVVARVICPYSSNGRVYPSGLLEKKVKDFIGLPIILGHTTPANPRPEVVGKVEDAVFDPASRCIIALIRLDDAKLTKELINAIEKKRYAFSIEGEAEAEKVAGEVVVKDLKVEAIALVPEPGINYARPLVVTKNKVKLVEAITHLTSMDGNMENPQEVKPSENEKKEVIEGENAKVEVEEQMPDGVNAPGYAGPVYVNVNVNVVGREDTESKVQSQKGEEEDEEQPQQRMLGTRPRPAVAKLQSQKGKEVNAQPAEEKMSEAEECIDEACKKKKKKSKEEEECVGEACKKRKKKNMKEDESDIDEECVDEACKKKKKKKEEAEETDEDCIDEACKKRKKKKKSKEEIDDLIEKLLESLVEAEIDEIIEEYPDLADEIEAEREFIKGIIELAYVKEASSQDVDCEKCKKLEKKYGIPCLCVKPRHPECIDNPNCCDPVNGFWPIDRAGRARIAMYLMARHWVKMSKRYGLKGWAKIVDCIVTKAKKFGINVKCSTLKERQPNIWPFLKNAKKLCVEDNYSQERWEGILEKVVESIGMNKFDENEAIVKITESLSSPAKIHEAFLGLDTLVQPIYTKIQTLLREIPKLWGKIGTQINLDFGKVTPGTVVRIPFEDIRTVEAPAGVTDWEVAPTEIDVSLTYVDVTTKKTVVKFTWSKEDAKVIKNLGARATKILATGIANRLDKDMAGLLDANAQAFNYDPNDVYNTVKAPTIFDFFDVANELTSNGFKVDAVIMPPKLLTELAKQDDTVRQALIYAGNIQPGKVIDLMGFNVIVGDNYVTPVVNVPDPTGTNPDKLVAYAYVLDHRAVVYADSGKVDTEPYFNPLETKQYAIVATKYYGLGVAIPEAVKKLAFQVG